MSIYTVERIKEEAQRTFKSIQGRRSDSPLLHPFMVGQAQTYCRKVLFLCREIEKLRKKKKKVSK